MEPNQASGGVTFYHSVDEYGVCLELVLEWGELGQACPNARRAHAEKVINHKLRSTRSEAPHSWGVRPGSITGVPRIRTLRAHSDFYLVLAVVPLEFRPYGLRAVYQHV